MCEIKNSNYNNNNNNRKYFSDNILTIKILFTINSLLKKTIRQNTISNSFRKTKKHLVLVRKEKLVSLIKSYSN